MNKKRASARFLLLLFCVAFYLNYFATLVLSAVRAYHVRKPHLAAVAALYKIHGFKRVMRAAAVSPAFW